MIFARLDFFMRPAAYTDGFRRERPATACPGNRGPSQRAGAWRIGFLQIMNSRLQDEFFADDLSAVTAGENHLQLGTFDPKPLGQLPAIYAVGHDQIGQHQIDLVRGRFSKAPVLSARLGRDDLIAVRREKFANQLANRGFVFDYEDGF